MAKEAKEFIEIWNTSGSVAEAARRARITAGAAIKRAARYRKKEVFMKRMPGGFRRSMSLDWDGLRRHSDQFNVAGEDFS